MEAQYKFEIWEEFLDEKSPTVLVFLKAIDHHGNAFMFGVVGSDEGKSYTNALRVKCSKRLSKSARKEHAINAAKRMIYGPDYKSLKRDTFNDREKILNSGKLQWRDALIEMSCLHPDSDGDKKREAHNIRLYVRTKEFGCMEAFYYRGIFMHNYACPIMGVIEWMYLPE